LITQPTLLRERLNNDLSRSQTDYSGPTVDSNCFEEGLSFGAVSSLVRNLRNENPRKFQSFYDEPDGLDRIA
jgi:hypothetical protein